MLSCPLLSQKMLHEGCPRGFPPVPQERRRPTGNGHHQTDEEPGGTPLRKSHQHRKNTREDLANAWVVSAKTVSTTVSSLGE